MCIDDAARWRAVVGELVKVSSAKMTPVVMHLLAGSRGPVNTTSHRICKTTLKGRRFCYHLRSASIAASSSIEYLPPSQVL